MFLYFFYLLLFIHRELIEIAHVVETATAGYLIPSNRAGGVVLFVDLDIRSLYKIESARGGGFIIEHVVDFTTASIVELLAQLLFFKLSLLAHYQTVIRARVRRDRAL